MSKSGNIVERYLNGGHEELENYSKAELISLVRQLSRKTELPEVNSEEDFPNTQNNYDHYDWSVRLSEIEDADELFNFIGLKISSIVNDSVILLLRRTEPTTVILKNIYGIEKGILNKALKLFGKNPTGKPYKIDKGNLNYFNTLKIREYEGGLYEFALGTISKKTADLIERLFGVKHIYTSAMRGLNTVIGNVYFMSKSSFSEDDKRKLEAFIYQASIAVERLNLFTAVKENEKRVKDLLENINEAAYIHDTEGVISYISPAIEKISGFKQTDVIGKNFIEFIHPADTENALDHFKELLSGRPVVKEYRALTADGIEKWMRASGVPEFTEGVVTGVRGTIADITASKQSELQQKETEEKYRLLADNSSDIISLWSGTNPLYISPSIKKILGYTPDEFKKINVFDYMHPDDVKKLSERIMYRLENKISEPWTYSYRQKHKDGNYVWLETRENVTYKPDGERIAILNIRDVTKLYEVQAELEENLRQQNILLSAIPAVVFFKDENLRYRKVNAPFLKYVNLEEEDIIGKNDWDIFPAEVAEMFANEDRKIIDTGEALINKNEMFIDENNKKVYITTNKIPVWNDDEAFEGIVGISTNITELKENEEDLQKELNIRKAAARLSSQLLSEKMDLKAIAVAAYNICRELTEAELSFISVIDNKSEDMISLALTDRDKTCNTDRMLFKKTGESYPGLWGHALNTRTPFYVNKPADHSASTGLPADHPELRNFLSVPAMAKGRLIGQVALANKPGVFNDDDLAIIERIAGIYAIAILRHDYEEELKNKAIELEKLVNMKDKLFSIIVHDIQNPIHSFIGLGEVLQLERNAGNKDKVLKIGNLIFESAKQTNQMIQNLVVWSRVESGSDKIQSESVYIKSIVNNIFKLVEPAAHKKEISLVNKIPEEIALLIDPSVIEIIIRNLVSNSIKFTSAQGRIVVDADKNDKETLITVSDNGMGIPEEILAELLDSKINKTRSGTDNEKGSGLGLMLSNELMKNSGGTLEIESREGKGTTVRLRFPSG